MFGMTFTAILAILAIALNLANGGYVYKTEYFTVPVSEYIRHLLFCNCRSAVEIDKTDIGQYFIEY